MTAVMTKQKLYSIAIIFFKFSGVVTIEKYINKWVLIYLTQLFIPTCKTQPIKTSSSYPANLGAIISAMIINCHILLSNVVYQLRSRNVQIQDSLLSTCKSMHSYDATIDLCDRDTIKQDKPRVDGSRCGSACYNGLLNCNPDDNPGCNTGGLSRICQG